MRERHTLGRRSLLHEGHLAGMRQLLVTQGPHEGCGRFSLAFTNEQATATTLKKSQPTKRNKAHSGLKRAGKEPRKNRVGKTLAWVAKGDTAPCG